MYLPLRKLFTLLVGSEMIYYGSHKYIYQLELFKKELKKVLYCICF